MGQKRGTGSMGQLQRYRFYGAKASAGKAAEREEHELRSQHQVHAEDEAKGHIQSRGSSGANRTACAIYVTTQPTALFDATLTWTPSQASLPLFCRCRKWIPGDQ